MRMNQNRQLRIQEMACLRMSLVGVIEGRFAGEEITDVEAVTVLAEILNSMLHRMAEKEHSA